MQSTQFTVQPAAGTSLAHDVLHQSHAHPLDPFFRPRSVALIGATDKPGSVGRTLLHNLITTPFGGTVYPVNPKRESVLGLSAYASVAALPSAVDLAVIATPAPSVPAVVGAVRRSRNSGGCHHFGRLSRDRTSRRGSGA